MRSPASDSPPQSSDGGFGSVGSGWKLSLPSLSAERSRPGTAHRDVPSAITTIPPSSPSPSASPMSSFAHAFSMKKRLSDSITDGWSRRRPSLPQGSSSGTAPTNSSRLKDSSSNYYTTKSRNRSSSATTAGAGGGYPRSPPPTLNSSASVTTLDSTSSSTSSYMGLSRQDSYSDMIAKGFPPPPNGSTSSRENFGVDSPTVPYYDPTRNMSSRPIASRDDLREVDENPEEYQGGYWEHPAIGADDGAANRAAADVGMSGLQRSTQSLTRGASGSRRIGTPEVNTPVRSPYIMGDANSRKIYTDEATLLGVPPSLKKRESTVSETTPTASTIQPYDISSDEESTTSSMHSGFTNQSTSSKASLLPQTISFSHQPNKRVSRNAHHPPPLDLPYDRQSPLTGVHNLPRSLTSSPMKSRVTPISSMNIRSIAAGLGAESVHDSGSRLSSMVSNNNSASSSGHPSAASSRTTSTAMGSVARSDSNSSNASAAGTVSKTPSASIASSASSHKELPHRDHKPPVKNSLAAAAVQRKLNVPSSMEPPIPDPALAPKVDRAPPGGMYWYRAPVHGMEHKAVRAHSCALIGSSIYVFGGCDKECFNDLHVFDADSMSWSNPHVSGEIPPPLRAMTITAVRNKLVIFGGGDGPTYYNDIYVFDTATSRFSKPALASGQQPCRRRAHTACLYKNGIYIFGGGDGIKALNDVWRLDVSDLNKPFWKQVSAPSSDDPPSRSDHALNRPIPPAAARATQQKPTARGYHTANMVGTKLIIYGGSDGDDCFKDVWVFDVETARWTKVDINKGFSRLSHTATNIGSYLFVVGGHDGKEYSSEVLLLNLITMQWDRRVVYGKPPSGRGYHCAVLYDSRLFIIGGFDGQRALNDIYILELAVSSYYSQISQFNVDVNPRMRT
ncbi:hypothetical protein EDC01DRAFT_428365 [Geopyxis carbonaria]|nr:hypothetical protein EDC01DRAFT_428365 [Geopyxis carbonaria]